MQTETRKQHRSIQRFWQIVGLIGGIGLGLTVLFFWLTPPETRGDALTWLGIGVSVLCAVGVVLATRQRVATWSGFATLVVGSVGAHLWLWWMWPLWESPNHLIRNVNAVVGLLAIDLLVVILVDAVLILIFRGGAPVFLAAFWLLYPLVLIRVALVSPDIEAFLAPENLRAQVLWFTPMTVLPSICCFSLPALLVHLAIVVAKEIRGRQLGSE